MMLPPAPAEIDLNADVGEHTTPEQREVGLRVMRCVTSVNIACGGHAGDASTMRASLRAAAEHRVAAGAHPSYPDRLNFGRESQRLDPELLRESIREQLTALSEIARDEGVSVVHCKPHGALYHDASIDEHVAKAVLLACADLDAGLRLVGQAGSQAVRWWRSWGATVAEEGFVDRVYEPNGSLRSRRKPGALITDVHNAASQALAIASERVVRCSDGSTRPLAADTLCVHADTPNADRLACHVAATLRDAGVALRSAR